MGGTGSDSARRSGAGMYIAGKRAVRAEDRGDASTEPASRELPRPRRGVSEQIAESGAVGCGGSRGVAGPDTESGGHTGTEHPLWLDDSLQRCAIRLTAYDSWRCRCTAKRAALSESCICLAKESCPDCIVVALDATPCSIRPSGAN